MVTEAGEQEGGARWGKASKGMNLLVWNKEVTGAACSTVTVADNTGLRI